MIDFSDEDPATVARVLLCLADHYQEKADRSPKYTPPKGGTTGRVVFTAVARELREKAEEISGTEAMCPNGQTHTECTELDPCETCWQDSQDYGDAIEASMGL